MLLQNEKSQPLEGIAVVSSITLKHLEHITFLFKWNVHYSNCSFPCLFKFKIYLADISHQRIFTCFIIFEKYVLLCGL